MVQRTQNNSFQMVNFTKLRTGQTELGAAMLWERLVPISCLNMHALYFTFRSASDCVHIQVCMSQSYELCSLTKHLFCTHMHAHEASWSFPHPPPRKVSGIFDVGSIDHHYYCSLLIPMEMRPAATVLGE